MVTGISCLSTVPTSKDITSMFSTIRTPEVRKTQTSKFQNVFVKKKMLKNEISIRKFCPQSVLKHSVVHFQGMAMEF